MNAHTHPPQSADIVIVGGGAAGTAVAHTLSRAGLPALVIDARETPVELPPLTDGLFAESFTPAALPTLPHITRLCADVTGLEAGAVHLADGSTISCGTLVLATGLTPEPSPLPGAHLVHSEATARSLRAAALEPTPAASLGVLGSGFLALELARGAAGARIPVDLHLRGDRPLPGCSPHFGDAIAQLTAAAGVRIHPRSPHPEPAAHPVWAAAVGARPNLPRHPADWALAPCGRLAVDAHLRCAPGVYAVGDCARVSTGPMSELGDAGAEPQALAQGAWLGARLAANAAGAASAVNTAAHAGAPDAAATQPAPSPQPAPTSHSAQPAAQPAAEPAPWADVPSHWSFQGPLRVFTAGAAHRLCDPEPVVLGDPAAGRGQFLFFAGPEPTAPLIRVETLGLPPAHNAAKRLLAPLALIGLTGLTSCPEAAALPTRAEAAAVGFDLKARSRQTTPGRA